MLTIYPDMNWLWIRTELHVPHKDLSQHRLMFASLAFAFWLVHVKWKEWLSFWSFWLSYSKTRSLWGTELALNPYFLFLCLNNGWFAIEFFFCHNINHKWLWRGWFFLYSVFSHNINDLEEVDCFIWNSYLILAINQFGT